MTLTSGLIHLVLPEQDAAEPRGPEQERGWAGAGKTQWPCINDDKTFFSFPPNFMQNKLERLLVVEQSLHHPKVEGMSLAASTGTGRENVKKNIFRLV
jgi:hypothetical protein